MCELVRPELAGKLSILGYFGICPAVDVGVALLDQPTVLTFLISGDAGEGMFSGRVAVVDEADERIVAATAETAFKAAPAAATVLAPALMLVFGRPGRYSLRLYVEQQERFRAQFRVSQGVPDLL